MAAANSLVALDINNPGFLESLFALEKNDKVQLLKQLEKISKLTWDQVQRDSGLKWEKIDPLPVAFERHLHEGKKPAIYSIRLTQAKRAIAMRDGNHMRFLALPRDHDSTYS